MENLSQRYVTLAEVKGIMKERRKAKTEFGFEHEQTEAYADAFAKLSADKAEKMMKKLEDMGIDDKYATQIVDLLPRSVAVLKLIFEKAERKPDEKEMNAIIELAKE